MDHIERAISTFRKPYSCAQTVYAAFKDASDASLETLKTKSGGRADGGECGALFAAKLLVDPQFHADMEKDFAAVAGDTRCKIIKGEHKTPCEVCVRTAAELVRKYASF